MGQKKHIFQHSTQDESKKIGKDNTMKILTKRKMIKLC